MKEVTYYGQEVKDNEAKLEQMKAENQDPYDIKKFQEVLDESYMMIPDSKSRLKQSLQDLASYVDSSDVEDVKSNEWYAQAKDLLVKEQKRWDSNPDDGLVETNVSDLKDGEAF